MTIEKEREEWEDKFDAKFIDWNRPSTTSQQATPDNLKSFIRTLKSQWEVEERQRILKVVEDSKYLKNNVVSHAFTMGWNAALSALQDSLTKDL